MEKDSLTSVKGITSSAAAPTSLTGTSTNTLGHQLMDEPRATLIISSSMANRETLQDVWGMRNADVGSDHNLLVALMISKLRNANIIMARNQQPDISKLKDTLIKEKFSITLRNRFCILQYETALTIDDFNTAIIESA